MDCTDDDMPIRGRVIICTKSNPVARNSVMAVIGEINGTGSWPTTINHIEATKINTIIVVKVRRR